MAKKAAKAAKKAAPKPFIESAKALPEPPITPLGPPQELAPTHRGGYGTCLVADNDALVNLREAKAEWVHDNLALVDGQVHHHVTESDGRWVFVPLNPDAVK